jgi:hypothetical protein
MTRGLLDPDGAQPGRPTRRLEPGLFAVSRAGFDPRVSRGDGLHPVTLADLDQAGVESKKRAT